MKRTRLRMMVTMAGALVALALFGVCVGPANAFDNTSDTTHTFDADAHYWNRVEPHTSGDNQYMVYWDAETSENHAALKLSRRSLLTNAMSSKTFSYELTDTSDAHNSVHMGISEGDGRIHIAWSTHSGTSPLEYVYSNAGCTSQALLSSCTWTKTNTQADSAHENRDVTYPSFFAKSDGTLFMTYRFGDSDQGDQYLNKYNPISGTWSAVGRVMHGYDQDGSAGGAYTTGGSYDPDGAGGVDSTNERGPYIWGMKFDPTGRLHLMWHWREVGLGTYGQHGVYYAISDDDGATWKNDDGTTVATSGSDPLKVTDAGLEVTPLPYGTWFGNFQMALDSHNQPHTILPVSDVVVDDPRDGNLRQKHIWRTTNDAWHQDWIEPAGGKSQTYSHGSLMFDRADDAFFIYNKNNLGWAPTNLDPFDQEELPIDRVTWQGGDHLNIQQRSNITAIVADDHVNTPISTGGNKQVRIRMRNNTEGDDFQVYWTTDAAPQPAWKTQTFTDAITTNDGLGAGDWETYTFTITNADWTGNLRDFEIHPTGSSSAEAGDQIDIDYVRITNSAGTIAKQWEFNEGAEIRWASVSPTDNWGGTWNFDTVLLPGVSDTWSDSVFPIDEARYAAGTGDDRKVSFGTTLQGGPRTESVNVHDFDIPGDQILKFWNFDVDTQGWTGGTNVSGFGYVSDGGSNSITGTITGSGSRVVSANNLKVKLETAADTLHVRMKNGSTATLGQVCFTTDAEQTFESGKCTTFPINANSGYTEYSVDMSGLADWVDGETLRQLRIDPADNASSGTFHIARVYIDQS